MDPTSRTAVVEPGVVLTDLTSAAAAYGLTLGADPSSGSRATLGGMIANNAYGAHSVAWGTTADNLQGLEVLLSDSTRMDLRTPFDRDLPDLSGSSRRVPAGRARSIAPFRRSRLATRC